MYDSWGSSWGSTSAWGTSWLHTAQIVVIDTHDDVERINEYKRRREELHESILSAFEAVTGETKLPTVQAIEEVQAKTKTERFELTRIKEQVVELNEVNQEIMRVSKVLQDREMQDIAFILSVL